MTYKLKDLPLHRLKKTYFISDIHLGSPNYDASLIREKKLVRWLDSIKMDAEQIFFVGDVFDFWFEYKSVIPRNFTRFLGKLAELADSGVKLYFFKGNHDMWFFDYLENEIGVEIISEEWVGKIGHHQFYIHHGDKTGFEPASYKFIRYVFRSKWGQWLFHRFHPNFGVWLAKSLSDTSRKSDRKREIAPEKDFHLQFALQYLQKNHIDFFIFGHRHKVCNIDVQDNVKLINLGDWINYFTFAEYDHENLHINTFMD